jgi:phosphoribosylformylglycinamidine (FGAM) synthase-like amidotransferase family enzyme
MMPHPERACDPLMGSTDGRVVFASIARQVAAQPLAATL